MRNADSSPSRRRFLSLYTDIISMHTQTHIPSRDVRTETILRNQARAGFNNFVCG